MKNKKASLFDIVIWVVVAFTVLIVLGLILWSTGLVTNVLEGLGTTGNGFNLSQAAINTVGVTSNAELTWVPIIAFIIIVCEGITIWITNFFVKEHPIMFIPYIFVTAIAVIVSVYLSNTYQGLLLGQPFSVTLQTFTMADYILIYLPLWTTIIGIIGAILLMAGIIVSGTNGGYST
jgi:hypothetical protein